ncbi:glycosyltransferase family 4 protein [Litorisediminicola beolgyonensis]|uniref:Glycosyltransferase family 4 protein n=1 Tax=Litorisediminicola beolgyonensis TaxID=1173614 RepID=A0ABW3ZDE5_9RHOB
MTRPRIIHLFDDATSGGIMRVLDYVQQNAEMSLQADHELRRVTRGSLSLGRYDADMVVSHLTVNWRSLPGLMALRAANPQLPLVHVEHSYTEQFVALHVPRRGRFETLLRCANSLFDRVVAVSAAQAEWMRARSLAPRGKLKVIRSAVDYAPFLALPEPTGAPRVVGAIGRLDPIKGFDVLIEAFRSDPDLDLELRIFGDGPEAPRLKALAAGDPRIRFFGHYDDPVAAMASVDIVAMPSMREAYGLVAAEARAAGRLLLVSPVDGLLDHVADGARAVHAHTPEAWAAALRSPDLELARMRMSKPDAAAFSTSWRNLIAELLPANRNAMPSEDIASL